MGSSTRQTPADQIGKSAALVFWGRKLRWLPMGARNESRPTFEVSLGSRLPLSGSFPSQMAPGFTLFPAGQVIGCAL